MPHHHVYVVYLRNPKRDGRAGYYVGMTGLTPDEEHGPPADAATGPKELAPVTPRAYQFKMLLLGAVIWNAGTGGHLWTG